MGARWVPEYCSISLQVGHKCQNPKPPVPQPKMRNAKGGMELVKQGSKEDGHRERISGQESVQGSNIGGDSQQLQIGVDRGVRRSERYGI